MLVRKLEFVTDETAIDVRLREQQRRIESAARSVGRDPSEVTLVAVSKKQGLDKIIAAYAAGQRDFGENYVQELMQKAEALSQYADIRWHLIGHLQTNKARFVAKIVHSVHTVSSVKLAQELGERVRQRSRTVAASPEATREQRDRARQHVQTISASPEAMRAMAAGLKDSAPPMSTLPLSILVEVNVGGEQQKSGCDPAELPAVLEAIDIEPGLRLRGLMTVPPFDPDPQKSHPFFDQLRELRDRYGGTARLPELSMGMSQDLEVAIEAGATIVRVGSAIFGARDTTILEH